MTGIHGKLRLQNRVVHMASISGSGKNPGKNIDHHRNTGSFRSSERQYAASKRIKWRWS